MPIWTIGTPNRLARRRKGVPVLPRQQLNGKYRVWIDGYILETIFVEHVYVQVCNKLKEALTSEGKKVRWQVVL